MAGIVYDDEYRHPALFHYPLRFFEIVVNVTQEKVPVIIYQNVLCLFSTWRSKVRFLRLSLDALSIGILRPMLPRLTDFLD